MENALKKPFRSYGKPEILGFVMISIEVRATPDLAKTFLLKKINLIEIGELSSSPYALDYVERRLSEDSNPQRFRRHNWTKIVKDEDSD